MWTKTNALAFCRDAEQFAAPANCHVALTGGCLYRHGPRRDLDIVFYRHGGICEIDKAALFAGLHNSGVRRISGSGWRYVGYHRLFGQVDFLFP